MAKRSTRKQKQHLPKRHTRKHLLKGGYFPSVYGGITGASMLAPLVARQALRMYNNTPRRHTKKTLRKKKLRNFTRANA